MRGPVLAVALALAAACAGMPDSEQLAACPTPGPRIPSEVGLVTPGDAARGERHFTERCAGCHAPRIAGRVTGAPPQTPRLDCPAWLEAVSDDFLYHAIQRGPGRYGHGGTPPLGELLDPVAVSDLVAHLRSLQAR